MSNIFFDIPFRTSTSDSDFICKDGEILSSTSLALQNPSLLNQNLQLPPPPVDFALVRTILPGWHAIPSDFPRKTLVGSDPSMEYWTSLASQLLAQFQSEAAVQSLFIAPFYVTGAWKTIDGRYLSPSSPKMLIPNSIIPLVATDDNITITELEFRIAGAVCSLYFKTGAPEWLRDYVGIIDSLDLLVSHPLYDLSDLSAILPSKKVGTDNFCRCLDISSGEISDTRVSTLTLPLAWTPSSYLRLENSHLSTHFYPFASVPLSKIDIANSWGPAGKRGIGDKLYRELINPMKYSDMIGGNENKTASPVALRGSDAEFSVETRPLKLSGAAEFKQIRRIYLRGHYTPSLLTISVYGSRDMLSWSLIAKRKGGTAVSLPLTSFRFYRVGVSGYLASSETLEGLTLVK